MPPSPLANISETLKRLKNRSDIDQASRELLKVLGYESDRRRDTQGKAAFLSWLYAAQPMDEKAGLTAQWKEARLIFQITANEVLDGDGQSLVKGHDVNTHIKSYLFVAVSLKNKPGEATYTRGELVAMTRAFNKPLSVPVFLVIFHDDNLSLAIIHRRAARRANRADAVLEKVSIIKDINLSAPCRAHVELLGELSLDAVRHVAKAKDGLTFEDVHRLWRKTLETKPLNEKFYGEISNWFYWACETVKLPDVPAHLVERYREKPGAAERENVRMFNLRLLSRMIFVWFMKERRLIAPELLELIDPLGSLRPCLFDDALDKKGFANRNGYYRGILQNIFFNCLNTKQAERKASANQKQYDRTSKDEAAKAFHYRGKRYLPKGFDFTTYFESVPYLNGGLFDVLEEDAAKDENDDDVISVPNCLFYATADDNFTFKPEQGKAVRVRGLNVILADYKFTVEENTPLEEDVALDPELLGMVFENLLAALDSVDEKAATAARKASGSFYTPRRVVDYMVTEAVRLYLETWMRKRAPACAGKVSGLVYHNVFNANDTVFMDSVVTALDQIKIFDPACGSGAFPMGMLHRIVGLLRMVDPRNELWLEHQLARLEPEFRDQVRKDLTRHAGDYSRKHGVIRNAIHGVDILPMAATITKLRFFISLLVEQKIDKTKPNFGLSPLPNLETKILCANSLVDLSSDLFSGQGIAAYRKAREEYFRPGASHEDRERLATEIAATLSDMYPQFAEKVFGTVLSDHESERARNRVCLRDWFLHANVAAPFFNLKAFFPEAADAGGFDIVIGNPPYGGTDISKDLQGALQLGSRDPYGAFIARFMGDGYRETPLKVEGVLSFIVSDTFMTIKTHRALRAQLMRHRIHKMIRVHPDTFGATVNTAVILLQRCQHLAGAGFESCIPADQTCQMVDLTNVSIHDDYERFLNLLFATASDRKGCDISTESCAVYHYPQALVATNTNLPFFVASPKLFKLMNDVSAPVSHRTVGGKTINMRAVSPNQRSLHILKLGSLAQVPQGISTGQNDYYLRRRTVGEGYTAIDMCTVLSDREVLGLNRDEQLNGVDPSDYEGRHFIPFDKGSETDTENNLLANYYVSSDYFIDWSCKSLARMRTLTIADRKRECGETSKIQRDDDRKLAAALRNQEQWFQPVISFSPTGQYSPTFRLGVGTVSQNTSSGIILREIPQPVLLGVLASRLARYLFKNYLNHTVHTQEGDVVEFPFPDPNLPCYSRVSAFVERIIEKQKNDDRYNYANNEQFEIDSLVYEAYGLNEDDLAEVETWFARRYPKLAAAQRENLRKLGKREPWLQHWDHYCDESGHLLRDDMPYMVLGMFSCPQGERRRLNLAIKALKNKHGVPEHREIKWVGVSPAQIEFYKALVDFFFEEPDVRFNALLAPKPPAARFFVTVPVESDAADAPESVRLVSPEYDSWYYQQYFDMIWDSIRPVHRHHIMVDSKDTRSGARVNSLQERLNESLFDYLGKTVPDVTLVESKVTPLSQMCDFLLGLVAFANQGLGKSPAKTAVVKHFAERLGGPLTADTGAGEKVAIRFGAASKESESEVSK